MSKYTRFIAMVTTSTLVMFGLMYLNTYALDHVYFSETRTWMALAWQKAMIPHHSIAILTSERARIEDKRVRELADGIIRAQRREIKEMQWLIKDIEENGKATTEAEAAARPVPEFGGKL